MNARVIRLFDWMLCAYIFISCTAIMMFSLDLLGLVKPVRNHTDRKPCTPGHRKVPEGCGVSVLFGD